MKIESGAAIFFHCIIFILDNFLSKAKINARIRMCVDNMKEYPRFVGGQVLLISAVNDPTDFTGQREEDTAALEKLFDLITAKIDKTSTLENPQTGDIWLH